MSLMKKVFNCEVKAINKQERTITALVSTGARDRMDEVLTPSGVDLKQYKKNPVVLWAHNYYEPPIARALWIKREGNGVISKMKFADTEFAQEIFELYEGGFMNAFSVGFIPKEWEDGDGNKKARRTYTKWEMLEYSAVPVPANPEAIALAMQKGILKDKQLISMLEPEPVNEVKEVEGVIEPTAPDKLEPKKEVEPAKEAETPNSELLADNEALKNENDTLKANVCELRWNLIQANKQKTKEQTLSGMTDAEILKKMEEICVGVIRKATGKVD